MIQSSTNEVANPDYVEKLKYAFNKHRSGNRKADHRTLNEMVARRKRGDAVDEFVIAALSIGLGQRDDFETDIGCSARLAWEFYEISSATVLQLATGLGTALPSSFWEDPETIAAGIVRH